MILKLNEKGEKIWGKTVGRIQSREEANSIDVEVSDMGKKVLDYIF